MNTTIKFKPKDNFVEVVVENIAIDIVQKNNTWYAFAPAFKTSVFSTKSEKDVIELISEATNCFFEFHFKKRTLEQILIDLGWKLGIVKKSPPKFDYPDKIPSQKINNTLRLPAYN